MTSKQILKFIQQWIANTAKGDLYQEVKTTSLLEYDLGLDSLDKIELYIAISDECKVSFDENETKFFNIVQDVIDYFKQD